MKILITGAGIGGLCTAIALQKLGHEVILTEQSTEIKAVGAGIVLAANAMKILEKLDLANQIIEEGKIVSEFNIIDHHGKILSEVYTHKFFDKFGIGNFTIARHKLHQVLCNNLKDNSLLLGHTLQSFHQDNSGIEAFFSNGNQIKADLLIASDGIHSLSRKSLLPNSKIRYAGYTCWRAIVDVSHITHIDFNKAFECWGPKGRFGFVPLKDTKIYYFICINAPQNDQTMKQIGINELIDRFKGYPSPIEEVLNATSNKDLIHNDIIDLKPINRFLFNKILLLGDAAHATTPNMGQGACQAIEDAFTLRNAFMSKRNLPLALADWEKSRIRRTHKVVNRSWSIGKAAQIESKMGIILRNFILRNSPSYIQEEQYKFLYQIKI